MGGRQTARGRMTPGVRRGGWRAAKRQRRTNAAPHSCAIAALAIAFAIMPCLGRGTGGDGAIPCERGVLVCTVLSVPHWLARLAGLPPTCKSCRACSSPAAATTHTHTPLAVGEGGHAGKILDLKKKIVVFHHDIKNKCRVFHTS